jgi:hypothetical protein
MTQPVLAILEPLLVQYDDIDVGESRESFATEDHRRPDSGPLLLMRAVLRDAILCLQGEAPHVSKRCRARVASEARAWIVSRDLRYAFSFESICDVLGLNAPSLRSHLLRLVPAPTAEGETESSAPRRRDMVKLLRRARMRGNFRTRVVARRGRRGQRSVDHGSCPSGQLEEQSAVAS